MLYLCTSFYDFMNLSQLGKCGKLWTHLGVAGRPMVLRDAPDAIRGDRRLATSGERQEKLGS